jgi:hypothetical protein
MWNAPLRDRDAYSIAEVNKDLARVYRGDTLVGQVRRGLDGGWYPELPAVRVKFDAVKSVIVADEAVRDRASGEVSPEVSPDCVN